MKITLCVKSDSCPEDEWKKLTISWTEAVVHFLHTFLQKEKTFNSTNSLLLTSVDKTDLRDLQRSLWKRT